MSSSLYKDEPTTNIIPSLYGLGSLTWAVHVKYWWNSCARIKWYSVLLRLEEWLLVEKTLGNRVENITQYNSYSMPLYLPSSSLLLPNIYRDSDIFRCSVQYSPISQLRLEKHHQLEKLWHLKRLKKMKKGSFRPPCFQLQILPWYPIQSRHRSACPQKLQRPSTWRASWQLIGSIAWINGVFWSTHNNFYHRKLVNRRGQNFIQWTAEFQTSGDHSC